MRASQIADRRSQIADRRSQIADRRSQIRAIISALLALFIVACSSNGSSKADGNTASVNQAILGCGGSGGTGGSPSTGGTGGALSNAGLQLQVFTAACAANQVQQFFRVLNNGTSAVKTSDIKIKFWVNDTSGSDIVGAIYTGGCLTNANGCYHQASGVTVAVTNVVPTCGTVVSHQVNKEITISSTDDTLLAPGQTWDNLQMALHLASWGNFNPGTNTWYSACLAASTYTPDPHFVVYYKGQFDHTPDVQVPSCRGGHGPFDFTRSPIEIDAWQNLKTGEDHPSEVTLTSPVDIQIPGLIWVRSGGNAGQGQLTLQYRNGSGPIDTCTYKGVTLAHPITEVDKALGLEYWLQSCSSGATKDQHKQASWVKVSVVSGDATADIPIVGVKFGLGGGCSGNLEPDLTPFEVTSMRQRFHWSDTKGLELTDPAGHPAIWQGMIYIEREEQLQWLDQLSVLWSNMPLDAGSLSKWNGKCGVVPHSADSKGKVVYAVFPALFFNIMRTNGVQADEAGVTPLFRFIVPSAPSDPKYVNSDGSLSYQGLADSGYLQWLTQHSPASPCSWYDVICHGESVVNTVYGWGNSLGSSVANGVTGGLFGDVVDLVGGIPGPTASPGDVILSAYVALGNIWTETKLILGEIAKLICGSVHLNLYTHIQERDGLLNPRQFSDQPIIRAWGPGGVPSLNGYGRPENYPVGAKVTLNQWGCGFIPSQNEGTIDGNGHASLEAVEGGSTMGDGFCIELETPYALMTSDVGPDTVCNFTVGNLWYPINEDWSGDVWINQAHTYTLAQLYDSWSYAQTVIGYQPNRANILVGSIANKVTNWFNNGQPLTACLTFPGITSELIDLAAEIPGIVIPPAISEIAADILKKDIFWPDSSGPSGSVDSRGVMTHEYGHYTQCSLAYQEGGSGALDGLLSRIIEGSDLSRSSELALMLETFADTFAMQVTGGANYVHPQGSTHQLSSKDPLAAMGWCTASPCMDYNYVGAADYNRAADNDSQFRDEVARWESLVYDAFDRSDSQGWFSSNTNNNSFVTNGDLWEQRTYGTLTTLRPAEAPFIMNDDEPVSLKGNALRTWVAHWLARGKTPNKQNMIGGLVDTIRDDGYTWCDACEVMATHYSSTPDDVRMANPTGQTRTMAIRTGRWEACSKGSEMSSFIGAAPNNHGNMLSSCAACPPLSHPDETGTACIACPSGFVPRGIVGASDGTACEECKGGVAGQDNECHDCGQRQIRVNNVCTDCPRGYGADKNTNTCVACPVDAIVVAPCQQTPGCNGELEVPFVYAAKPDDVCPNEFWLEIYGLDTCNSPEMYVQVKSSATNAASCTGSSGGYSVYLYTWPREWQGDRMGPFSFSPAHCTSDGKYCFKDQCTNSDSLGTFYLAGGNAILVDATITTNGNPAPGTVVISTPLCPQG